MKILVATEERFDINTLHKYLCEHIDALFVFKVDRHNPYSYTPEWAEQLSLRHVNRAMVYAMCDSRPNIVVVCRGANVKSMFWYFDTVITLHSEIPEVDGDILIHRDEILSTKLLFSHNINDTLCHSVEKQICKYLSKRTK